MIPTTMQGTPEVLRASTLWQPFRHRPDTLYDCLPHHETYTGLLHNSEKLAYLVRSYTVYEMTCAALGHPGGSLSEAELLAVLFDYALRYRAAEPGWEMRDVFYLSKCHACPSLYTVLALCGYFPLEDLRGYGAWSSHLESHPDSRRTPGIEVSGGSLGQIPGVAVGRALGMRRRGPDHADRMVYVLVGDGECQEGSVWEAFMAAGHYGLDNLVVLIDSNKVQAKGAVADDMSVYPLDRKLEAFGFDVYEVGNGHDCDELVRLFNSIRHRRRGKPIGVVVHTVKGKKVAMCQSNPNWHTSAPRSTAQAQGWLRELWEQDGRRLGIPAEFAEALGAAIEIVPPEHDNPDKVLDRQA